MLDFLKKKRRMKLNTKTPIPGETQRMGNYRVKITHQFEDLLTTVDEIRSDKTMQPQEKYSIMLASLYMVNSVSEELMNSDAFFGNDPQFKDIESATKKMLKGTPPNYIG